MPIKLNCMFFNWQHVQMIPRLLVDDVVLKSCISFDYLGIQLDINLSFEPHIVNLLANCQQRRVTLCKIRSYINQKIAIRIYKSIISAKLQYGFALILSMLPKEIVIRLKNFRTVP